MSKQTLLFELKRQSIHLSGLVIVALSYFLSYNALSALLLVCLAVAILFFPLKKILRLDFLDKFVRPDEMLTRHLRGTTSFFFGIIMVLLLFNSIEIFRISASVLILGDSFSTVFGKAYGRHKLHYNRNKSIEGTWGGFLVAVGGVVLIAPIQIAVLAAAVGLLVESLPGKLNDNYTIPIMVGFVLWFLHFAN